MTLLIERYRKGVRWAIEHRWVTVGMRWPALALAGFLMFSGVIGSEFLPHLDEGAIWVRGTLAPSTGPTEGSRVTNQARVILASFPEVTVVTQPGGPAGRRHRHHGLLQYRIFRRPQAQRTMAAGLPSEQRSADRRHGSRAGEDPGRHLEFLAAHRRQHGRSGQRRQRRARRSRSMATI